LNPVFGWLAGASREQKRALVAASLGWMLDSMDVMLYALVLGPVQRELHLSAAASGAMMSATLWLHAHRHHAAFVPHRSGSGDGR